MYYLTLRTDPDPDPDHDLTKLTSTSPDCFKSSFYFAFVCLEKNYRHSTKKLLVDR